MFQSPKSGKFESNRIYLGWKLMDIVGFQSPRSGKFESNEAGQDVPTNTVEGVSIP